MNSEKEQKVKLVIVLPVGPTCSPMYIKDTITSIIHYTTASRAIILLDDSAKGTGDIIKKEFPDIVVLNSHKEYGDKKSFGLNAGLYLNLSKGFYYAYENYNFDVLLRIDTDALIIGPHPEEEAITYFKQNIDVGIIGSYRIDCNGEPRDYSWAKEKFEQTLSINALLAHPKSRIRGWFFLHRMIIRSRKNGYELGEHCMGGAYFVSKECIKRLYDNNLLGRKEIHWIKPHEDQIFGLFTYSVGLKHGDFATGDFPMGLRHRGLPCSPMELLQKKKKITHSTRFFGDMNEQAIREYFRKIREIDN